MRIEGVAAVMGGSFDPPHLGHAYVVTQLLASGIKKALVVPSFSHAFKTSIVATYAQRLKMCRLAFRHFHAVNVLDTERAHGISKTYDLVRALEKEYGSLRIVIGSDLVTEFQTWYRADDLRKLAPPIIVRRAGYETVGQEAIGAPIPNISSTAVRLQLKRRDNLGGVLDQQVLDYIYEQALYLET